MNAPAMDYITDLGMWNEGRMDAWCTARAPGMGMGHFERTDLPYYYALADGFTIADQYHQSTFTQTTPNRLHLFSGCNGLAGEVTAAFLCTHISIGEVWSAFLFSVHQCVVRRIH